MGSITYLYQSTQNIQTVHDSPKTSIRHRGHQSDIKKNWPQRFSTKKLCFPDFADQTKLILNVRAHSHHNNVINTQNCCIWSSENPREIRGFTTSHSSANTLIGARYSVIIIYFFVPNLRAIDVDDSLFQQRGALSHTV